MSKAILTAYVQRFYYYADLDDYHSESRPYQEVVGSFDPADIQSAKEIFIASLEKENDEEKQRTKNSKDPDTWYPVNKVIYFSTYDLSSNGFVNDVQIDYLNTYAPFRELIQLMMNENI